MTRWTTKDLTGMLVKNQTEPKADQWHVVEFPAIMDHGSKNAKPVWPEYWKLDELEKVQATLPTGKWNAQWMQNPTAEEGAILKREWWMNIYTRRYTTTTSRYTILRHSIFEKRNSRLLCDYYMGYFYPSEDRRR